MDGIVIPVAAGLAIGVAFVIIFAVVMDDTMPVVTRLSADDELPQVKLVVMDKSNKQGVSYHGELGSYCWHSLGCADTSIIVPQNSINVGRGDIIKFEFLDSYHDNKPPHEHTVVVFTLNDLKVFSTTKGRPGGDVEIADYDIEKPITYLSDIGEHNYPIDLPEGEYIIWALSAWYRNGENPEWTYGDGDAGYFYRISVEEETTV